MSGCEYLLSCGVVLYTTVLLMIMILRLRGYFLIMQCISYLVKKQIANFSLLADFFVMEVDTVKFLLSWGIDTVKFFLLNKDPHIFTNEYMVA